MFGVVGSADRAAISIHVQSFVLMLGLSRSEIAGSYRKCTVNLIRNCHIFSGRAMPFCIPANSKNSCSSASSLVVDTVLQFLVVLFVYFSKSVRCVVIY